jgi:hypothetical protein
MTFQQIIQCGRIEWFGEQESLPGFAVFLSQFGELFVVLDALGESKKTKVLPEPYECPHEGSRIFGLRKPSDEGAIDLEHIDREAAKIAKRAIPGAEVIDGYPDPKVAKVFEAIGGPVRIAHERRFGDLKGK